MSQHITMFMWLRISQIEVWFWLVHLFKSLCSLGQSHNVFIAFGSLTRTSVCAKFQPLERTTTMGQEHKTLYIMRTFEDDPWTLRNEHMALHRFSSRQMLAMIYWGDVNEIVSLLIRSGAVIALLVGSEEESSWRYTELIGRVRIHVALMKMH